MRVEDRKGNSRLMLLPTRWLGARFVREPAPAPALAAANQPAFCTCGTVAARNAASKTALGAEPKLRPGGGGKNSQFEPTSLSSLRPNSAASNSIQHPSNFFSGIQVVSAALELFHSRLTQHCNPSQSKTARKPGSHRTDPLGIATHPCIEGDIPIIAVS